MNISQAARRSGVPAKTIRYYESIDLIPAADRTGSGYRVYNEKDVERLRFIHHSRRLGFTVKEVADLLALWQDRSRASADVKAVAARRVEEIDAKITELTSIRDTLLHLMDRCHGDERPDCPILDTLADVGGGEATAGAEEDEAPDDQVEQPVRRSA